MDSLPRLTYYKTIPSEVIVKTRVVIFLLYLILFEGIIFKYILGNSIGSLFIKITDYIPLLVWVCFIPKFQYRHSTVFINSLMFWFIWICIIALLIVGDIRHYSSFTQSIGHIGVLIRYIPIGVMVVDISRYRDILSLLLHNIDVISKIIVITSWLSILLGSYAYILFPILPSNNTAMRELQLGWHSGIFPNTIDLGFVLVIIYLYWLFKHKPTMKRLLLYTLIVSIPTYKTGSVASLGMIFILFLYRISYNRRKLKIFIIVSFIGLIIGSLVLFKDYYSIIIVIAMQSRLGILTKTLPAFLKEMSTDTFFGIGTNMDVIFEKVNSYPEKVHILEHLNELGGFADVYWFALIVYHGVIGFILIFILLFMIYNVLTRTQYCNNIMEYKGFIKGLFMTLVILGFFNQVLAVKTYSLFFWFFLGILYSNIKNIYYGHKCMEKVFY